MKHYVCLKMGAEHDLASLFNEMERVLAEAQNTLPGFRHHQVLKETIPGTKAVSVLTVLDFASCEEKGNYLRHPLHLALLQQIKPAVIEKSVFDSAD